MSYRWVFRNGSGGEIGESDTWDSRQEAEAWMADSWAALLEGEARSVSLRRDGEIIYEMDLTPEDG
jgi:hypothetical protein